MLRLTPTRTSFHSKGFKSMRSYGPQRSNVRRSHAVHAHRDKSPDQRGQEECQAIRTVGLCLSCQFDMCRSNHGASDSASGFEFNWSVWVGSEAVKSSHEATVLRTYTYLSVPIGTEMSWPFGQVLSACSCMGHQPSAAQTHQSRISMASGDKTVKKGLL